MLRNFVFLLVCFVLFSCENETKKPIDPNATQFEQDYYEDYDDPFIKWGYIDKQAKIIIEPIYDDTRDFRSGIALANLKGKWGYININGENIIPHKYVEASSFSGGAALVKSFDGSRFFIDIQGNELFKVEADDVKEFNNGLALFLRNGFWGAYDKNGKEIITPDFNKLKILTDDLLIARRDKKYAFLDHHNHTKTDFLYDKIYWEKDFPFVVKQDKKYGLLDQNLTKVIDTDYDKIGAFHGKYALAQKDGIYVLIDRSAKQIKTLNYDRVEYAGEGKWKYRKNGKWGLLDEMGEVVTAPIFYLLNRYNEGMLVYGLNEDRWGFLNEKGEIVTEAIYPLLWDYHNGLARIIGYNGFGFVDKLGNEVIPPQYKEVRDFNDGLARAQIIR